MDQCRFDVGTLSVITQRIKKWRYPEALKLQARLDAGEKPTKGEVVVLFDDVAKRL